MNHPSQTTDLPTGEEDRSATQNLSAARHHFILPDELSDSLRGLSQRAGVPLPAVLLAGFQALLMRYTQQEQVAVAAHIFDAEREGAGALKAVSVTSFLLRSETGGNPTFRELLVRVAAALGADARQELTLDVPAESFGRDAFARSPLTPGQFIFRSFARGAIELRDGGLTLPETCGALTPAGGRLEVTETGPELKGCFLYDELLWQAETARRMCGHWQTLLEGAAADADRRLSELPLLTLDERHQLLTEWNKSCPTYEVDECVHELFEAQAELCPDRVAVLFNDESLTYVELNRRANQLAGHLRRLGVGPEVLVGVYVERGIEMLVALLAVLKAGAAYVPLDPSYPKEWLAAILEDAAAPVLLTQERLRALLPPHTARVVAVAAEATSVSGEDKGQTRKAAVADNLAYIIYTSGSTGRPKGVAITHRSAATLLRWAHGWFAAADLRRVLASTSICFDLSVFELFVPLSYGGTVVLTENALALPEVAEKEITLVNTVPSVMTELVRSGGVPESVRVVNLAGEPLKRTLVESLYGRGSIERVVNLYGPSETTTYSTAGVVPRGAQAAEPSIGRPIANTQIYLLDQNLQPVPVGLSGEIYIGGDGLGRGYLRRPAQTAASFIPDPFGPRPGRRLYKTGDLARYLPDGQIEFLGRRDHQVKVRGFRIELGEVEAVLCRHEAVREAVVLAREDAPGEKRLAAYVVASREAADITAELRGFVAERLPQYMIPSAFVLVESLPLMPNGKVDRRALPPPGHARPLTGEAFVAPQTPLEKAVAGVWAEVLRIEHEGARDNFFMLGGHSLDAARVISRLREIVRVPIPLRQIFEHPTVSELARSIEAMERGNDLSTHEPIAPVPRGGHFPLSYAQERMWAFHESERYSTVNNLSAGMRLRAPLDLAALERALNEVVRRHEVFRTRFKREGGRPVQVIGFPWQVELPPVDLSGLARADAGRRAAQLLREETHRVFDLAEGRLLRALLLRLSAEEYALLLTTHHLVSDGWSIEILLGEITSLYEAFRAGKASPLKDLPIQYADYAAWQRRWLQGEVLERKLRYWKERLQGAPALLELPFDGPRPDRRDFTKTFRGAREPFTLDPQVSHALREVARREKVSLFMLLLAALQALLWHYCKQETILVGTTSAGRTRSELEDLIGLFANQLVFRTDLAGELTFVELLHRVQGVALGAYEHLDLPFGKLVKALNPDQEPSRLLPPPYQVKFSLETDSPDALESLGLTTTEEAPDDELEVKLDIILAMRAFPEHLSGNWIYNRELFKPRTIRRMSEHFRLFLKHAARDQQSRLSTLLAETER